MTELSVGGHLPECESQLCIQVATLHVGSWCPCPCPDPCAVCVSLPSWSRPCCVACISLPQHLFRRCGSRSDVCLWRRHRGAAGQAPTTQPTKRILFGWQTCGSPVLGLAHHDTLVSRLVGMMGADTAMALSATCMPISGASPL